MNLTDPSGSRLYRIAAILRAGRAHLPTLAAMRKPRRARCWLGGLRPPGSRSALARPPAPRASQARVRPSRSHDGSHFDAAPLGVRMIGRPAQGFVEIGDLDDADAGDLLGGLGE